MKETKLAIAHRLVLATPDKSLALNEIMSVLGVTRANAFVYFTKVAAKRVAFKEEVVAKGEAKGEAKGVTETVGKTTHLTRKKVVINPVTLLNPIRKASKLNEIDAFISQLPKTPSFMPV